VATAGDAGAHASRTLQERVVLVSGAHGGLGRAASIACARAGATVVLLGRKVPKLNRVYDAIAKQPGAAWPEPVNYPLDLEGASPDDYAELAERIGSRFGRLDGVLHCAAEFRGLASLERSDPATFARAIHVNLTARAWLTQACLPLLRQATDSAVVFAVDDRERVGRAYWGGYGLAQHATAALVGMLHAELANSPVRVSGLQPGPMRTSLRAQAYVEEDDGDAGDPARHGEDCVTLLSAAGAEHRGQVWAPAQ
jgi:NAD(P)-dependent dehydrogenase (short-subunit alcohol dehydrogenase family)